MDSSLPSGVISPGNNNGQSQPSRPEELELDNCAKSKHNCESLPIEMFVQDCMSSLPKVNFFLKCYDHDSNIYRFIVNHENLMFRQVTRGKAKSGAVVKHQRKLVV